MAILHTVNTSPFDNNSFESCLRHVKAGSSLLLIEDGVYAVTTGHKYSTMLQEAMSGIKVYVLESDLAMRGVREKVMDGVTLVDYGGFVDLAAEHNMVQSWL